MQALRRPRVALWTRERIESLTTPEVRQLQANAQRLGETEIAALCGAILDARPRGHAPVRKPKARRKRDTSRATA